jgi:tRNA(Arg) A34 adenosine deaminase TadA
VAEGFNQVTGAHDPTAHAEVSAIRAACKALQTFTLAGCQIYSSCEPCPMCLSAIYWARLDHLYYAATRGDAADIGFDDDFIYNEIGAKMEDRKIPFVHFPSSQAKEVFDAWKNWDNKKKY